MYWFLIVIFNVLFIFFSPAVLNSHTGGRQCSCGALLYWMVPSAEQCWLSYVLGRFYHQPLAVGLLPALPWPASVLSLWRGILFLLLYSFLGSFLVLTQLSLWCHPRDKQVVWGRCPGCLCPGECSRSPHCCVRSSYVCKLQVGLVSAAVSLDIPFFCLLTDS